MGSSSSSGAGAVKHSVARRLARAVMAIHRILYRASGARVGGSFGGAPVLLLTTTGGRTGKRRTTPLLFLEQKDRLVVVASNGGSDRTPTWFLNLRKEPRVEVEIGSRRHRMHARPATAGERAKLWPKVVELYGRYEAYQARTERRIPLVILSPDERD